MKNPWIKSAINAGLAGGIAALAAAWVDPTAFDITTLEGAKAAGILFLVGAVKAVYFLFQKPPQTPTTTDNVQPRNWN